MRYTPVELRHIRVGRSLFGYKRHDIDKLLEDVADSFEEVWSERGELADKVEDLGKILADVKERESLLAATLVSAERAAADARDQAKKEAELIVAEAHVEARSVTRGAQGERDRLFGEVRRVETLLRAALGMVEEDEQDLPAAGGRRGTRRSGRSARTRGSSRRRSIRTSRSSRSRPMTPPGGRRAEAAARSVRDRRAGGRRQPEPGPELLLGVGRSR